MDVSGWQVRDGSLEFSGKVLGLTPKWNDLRRDLVIRSGVCNLRLFFPEVLLLF